MMIARYAAPILALGLLAGCGGVSTSPPQPPSVTTGAYRSQGAAKAQSLLFAADYGYGKIGVFILPEMKLVKRIGNFKGSYPTGECSDKRGNVWVASPPKHEMLEYSHDGKLVHTILISHEHLISYALYGCAVNPVNGALAVVDAFGRRNTSGKLLVYSGPSAKPVVLRNPDQIDYFAAAYDSSGDLWTTGYGDSPMVSACGAKSCRTVILRGGSIYDPISIAWDNVNHGFVILDNNCHQTGTTCSYPVSTNGKVGRPTTYFNHMGSSVCLLSQAQIVVTGKTVMLAGGDNESSCTSYKESSVDLWAYPTGGLPVQYSTKVADPWGVAVSTGGNQ